MSDSQKIPLINSLAAFSTGLIERNNTLDGKSLPCHVTKVDGAIVTVQFDILPGIINLPEVTVPVFGPEYIRYPIQIGDKGVCVAMSVSIGAVSGLGVGLPDMNIPPALTALVFLPIGNTDWSKVDPDKVVIYGKTGVLARTESGDASITIEPSKVTIAANSGIYLKAPNIYLNGVIHLNGPIVQDAGKCPALQHI
ncbi:phage baseplate protein [Budvicia aquatica]|uniref:Phage protein Gp138 N-terminal domain-containing protein n=1 Tax=Budvicia aquatica TaxID=82979 RepID=A0A484ZU63_9GAMM|nr:phage baseplate protein [Budvicia aquatica]VFS51408.1 Uncharacterised protein [Budvicia aquatica]